MPANIIKQAIYKLGSSGASLRCDDVRKLLEGLGFTVRDGKNGGHKVFTHAHIRDFLSGSFNCEHGRNPQIKRPYIKKVSAILQQHESDLSHYLENRDD